MISPSFWSDEKLGENCNITERLLFLGLISNADDEGIGRANPKYLKSIIFPYDDMRSGEIEQSLKLFNKLHLIELYEVDGQLYYMVTNFLKHQTINKATPTEHPKPPKLIEAPKQKCDSIGENKQFTEDYRSPTTPLPPNRIEENRKEEKIKEKNICPEQKFAPASQPIFSLPLNDKSLYSIYQEQIDKWHELYPAVNIMQELKNMYGWIDANPRRRKTKAGITRFINSWLSSTQNKGGAQYGNNPANTSAHMAGSTKYGTKL